ncbi:MAG TPA: hypothetical protein VFG69_14020, partial [Nannocystaceae bacterium]|nr:hypothetical protein [Nannocystaceae bacterium]
MEGDASLEPLDEPDPSDPYVRSSQTFARLDPDMVRRVAAFGSEERPEQGTLLFRQGDRSVDFFV